MSLSFSRLPRLRLPFGKLSLPARLNRTGAAGPRRLLVIAGVCGAVGAVLLGATFHETTRQSVSHPGRLPPADPLPGGPNSNPYQDALAMQSNQEAAALQQQAGGSYTPQIAASRSYTDKPHKTRALLTSPAPAPAPAKAAPAPPAAPSTPGTAAPTKVTQVASPQGGQSQGRTNDPEDLRYKAACRSAWKIDPLRG